MRRTFYRSLFLYWLAIAFGGALAFMVPVVGFPFGIGMLLYFVYAIPYWLWFALFFRRRERKFTLFSLNGHQFNLAVAGLGLALLALFLLLGWKVLACFGAVMVYVGGELEIKDRIIAAGAGGQALARAGRLDQLEH
jgi:hypothetical protein